MIEKHVTLDRSLPGPDHRASIEPDWNAERKDKLEWKLRDLACAGQLDVPEIQREIAADWIRLYQHVFRK